MLIAEIDIMPQSVGGWVGLILAVGTAAGGAVVWVRNARKETRKDTIDEYKDLLKRSDDRIRELENQRKSYREIAEEALEVTEREVNTKRVSEGKRPFVSMADVVPERSSPVTKEQQESADLQTVRARITAVKVALELPPRETGEPETEEQRRARQAIEPARSSHKEEKDAVNLVAMMKLKEKIEEKIDEVPAKVVEKLDEREAPKKDGP